MKIKELFKSTDVTQSVGGLAIYLDKNNCKIAEKTRNKDSVLLRLKGEFGDEEGHAYLRVQDKFQSLEKQLLNWAFVNEKIIGLTLNELDNFETDFSIESIGGKMQLKK